MGILGKNDQQKEEFRRQMEEVASRIDDVSSHVNALDNALDDFQYRIQQLENDNDEEPGYRALYGNNKERIKDLKEDIQRLDEQVEQVAERQQSRLDDVEDISRNLFQAVSGLKSMVKKTRKHDRERRDDIERLRKRLDSLETDYTVEKNQNEYDIERKLDSQTFNNRKSQVDKELGKLRTSVNAIAEELDKEEEIEIED